MIREYNLALFGDLIEDDGDIVEYEISAPDYQRQKVALLYQGDGLLINAKKVEFGPAKSKWGRIMTFGLFEGSNLVSSGLLFPAEYLQAGETAYFDPGSIKMHYREQNATASIRSDSDS